MWRILLYFQSIFSISHCTIHLFSFCVWFYSCLLANLYLCFAYSKLKDRLTFFLNSNRLIMFILIFFLIWLFTFEKMVIMSITDSNRPPKLEEFKHRRTQNIGTKFTMFCSPQEGIRPFHYEWFKNGQILPKSSSNHRIEMSEDNSLFIVHQLTPNDSANFSCSVRNQFGSDSQYTLLTVKGLHT